MSISPSNIETNYSLYNIDNFKKSLDVTINVVLMKYKEYIFDFFNFILDNIKVKNNKYYNFIITRGLETITHVFLNILYYTKNMEITCYHSQKSIYFYVEFVSQISEEQNMFLQLTSRDATSYVYKKTIYEINNEFKKNMLNTNEETIKQFNIITESIKIKKVIFTRIINNIDIFINDRTQFEKYNKLCTKIISIMIVLNKIQEFMSLIEFLDIEIKNNDIFLETSLLIIKKINKNEEILNIFLKKIRLEDNKEKYINNSPEKIVNWFCQ